MLPLISERFERTLCRALFVALCLLPTLCIAGWTYQQRRTGQRAACQQALAEHLGVSVKLGHVEHTRPGAMRLSDAEFRDPETNELLAQVAQIEATRHGEDLWLSCHNAALTLSGCRAWGAIVERHMRRPAAALVGKVHLSAKQAQIASGEKQWPIDELAGTLTPSPERVEARLALCWRGAAAERPLAVRLIRERAYAEPLTRVELNTGGAPFPVALAAPWIDCPAWLGSGCTMQGQATVEIGNAPQRWMCRAKFDKVDLEQLVAQHFAHEMSGDAQLDLTAEGHGPRVLEAFGQLSSRQGTIGRSLLSALQRELAMGVAPLPAAMGDRFRYLELNLGYALSEDGSLQLAGKSKYAQGAVVVDANGVLVREPPLAQDCRSLIRVLAERNAPTLPAEPRTAALVRLLPTRGETVAATVASPATAQSQPAAQPSTAAPRRAPLQARDTVPRAALNPR